jgi:hypothetical protein
MTIATLVISPATKPPPGRLCPRSKMYTDTVSDSGSSGRISIEPERADGLRWPRAGPRYPGGACRTRRSSRACAARATIASTVISPERIETTEIDQDHIDDVGAAAAGKRLLQ